MKNSIIMIVSVLFLSGCAFKLLYGFQFEYEGNRDEIKEEIGRDGENK